MVPVRTHRDLVASTNTWFLDSHLKYPEGFRVTKERNTKEPYLDFKRAIQNKQPLEAYEIYRNLQTAAKTGRSLEFLFWLGSVANMSTRGVPLCWGIDQLASGVSPTTRKLRASREFLVPLFRWLWTFHGPHFDFDDRLKRSGLVPSLFQYTACR